MNFCCPSCSYFIIDCFDSWKRQQIAGGDSNAYTDSFRYLSNIKTGWVFDNSISAQIHFVRRKGESAFPARSTPWGFSSQHSPLAMYRITEVFYNSLQLPHKGMLFHFIFHFGNGGANIVNKIASSMHAYSLVMSQKCSLRSETRRQRAQHTIASLNSYRNGPFQINSTLL